MSKYFRPITVHEQRRVTLQSQWWALVRSCCLQDDDYWWLVGRFEDEERFRRIFYRTWVTEWFLRTAKQRSRRGSVNTLWLGQQRGAKSYSLLSFILGLDPTFAPNIKQRLTFKLRDLKARLDGAAPGSFFMHDEIQKGIYGEGAKWTIDQISNFLEQHAKTGTSIGFATPIKKYEGMLAGINFSIEIIGYNAKARISMGILRSHRGIEIGLVFFWHPPQTVADQYEGLKDGFLGGEEEKTNKYQDYIEDAKRHEAFDVSQSVLDYDTILWEQNEDMPTTLRGKIARKIWLLQKKQQVRPTGQPRHHVIVVQDDFIGVLRQCARQHLLPLVSKPIIAERWLLRYFDKGMTWKRIMEELGERRDDTVRKSIVDKEDGLDARLSNDVKARMLEEATCLYLNAHTLPSSFSHPSSTEPLSWRVGGGGDAPDVAFPALAAPRVAVNCKLFFQHRASWTVKVTPESEVAPAGGAWLLVVELGPLQGALGPLVYRIPHNARTVTTGKSKGAGSVEEVAWSAWLEELKRIVIEGQGGDSE